jgi:chromosome partitioning protein
MTIKILAIISQKGGAGKTTLSTHLAVMAESYGLTTALFDLDQQASAELWADSRGESVPAVVGAKAPRLAALLDQARQQGADLVIIDTPPEAAESATAAAKLADAALIPCRPSGLDLAAIPASIRIVQSAGKPFFVVCNAAPVQGSEVDEMRAALAASGVEMSPVVLHQRKAYSAQMHEGRTASEAEPKGKAAEEIRTLFLWICEKVIMLPSEQVKKFAKQHVI